MTIQTLLRKRVFRKTVRILEKHGLPYWLESGTLLNLVRRDQPAVPPPSKTIEIGMPGQLYPELMALRKAFAPFYRLREYPDLSARQWIDGHVCKVAILNSWQKKQNAWKVMISLKFKVGDEMRWVDTRSCKRVAAHYFDQLERVEANGKEYLIPSDAEEYLQQRYGEGKHPPPTFISSIDDMAIVDDSEIKRVPAKKIVKPFPARKIQLEQGDYRQQMGKMLFHVIDVLERNEIPYWLMAGTLLGILRDDDLLPWDYDADLGIPGEYGPRAMQLWRQFLPTYLVKKRVTGSQWLPENLRVVKIKRTWEKVRGINFHIDLFCTYKVGHKYRWIGSDALKHIDEKYLDKLETVDWAGRRVYIPSQAEEYLTICYGNWRVPDPDFDSGYQDGSIAEKGF